MISMWSKEFKLNGVSKFFSRLYSRSHKKMSGCLPGGTVECPTSSFARISEQRGGGSRQVTPKGQPFGQSLPTKLVGVKIKTIF